MVGSNVRLTGPVISGFHTFSHWPFLVTQTTSAVALSVFTSTDDGLAVFRRVTHRRVARGSNPCLRCGPGAEMLHWKAVVLDSTLLARRARRVDDVSRSRGRSVNAVIRRRRLLVEQCPEDRPFGRSEVTGKRRLGDIELGRDLFARPLTWPLEVSRCVGRSKNLSLPIGEFVE